jgi:hypothetical protein
MGCNHCGETIELEKLEMLKHYDMQCFKCKTGRCAVVNLSKKFAEVIAGAKSELLLPVAELGILQTLESEKRLAQPVVERVDGHLTAVAITHLVIFRNKEI